MKRFLVAASLCAVALSAFAGGTAPKSVPNATTNEAQKVVQGPATEDPVGYIDGAVYEIADDLRVVCPDIDLVMRRSYSSSSEDAGPLGLGWTHPYDWRVVRTASEVRVHTSGERGATDVFRRFSPPARGGVSYDAHGFALRLSQEGRYSIVTPEAMTYSFDAAGRLASIALWNGTAVSIARNSAGRVVRVGHSCGKFLSFEYDAAGSLGRVSTPDPSVWAEYSVAAFAGTAMRVLTSVVRHDGMRASTNLYEYAQSPRAGTASSVSAAISPTLQPGLKYLSFVPVQTSRPVPQRPALVQTSFPRYPVLVGKTDANGIASEFEYARANDAPHAKCARMGLSGGLFETRLAYLDGKTVEERPFAGGTARMTLAYNAAGRETSRVVGAETAAKTYDAKGDMVRETLTNSVTGAFVEWRAAYDARHRVVSGGSAYCATPSRFTQIAWDDRRGIPSRVVSPEGRVSEWTTNGSEIVVYGAGADDVRDVAHIYCDEAERPVTIVSPDGGVTEIAYDDSGYATHIAASALPSVTLGYDALGFVNALTLAGPDGTSRSFTVENNWRGNPLSVQNPDGTVESFEYDGNGRRVTREIDALGREDVYKWVLGMPVHAGRVIGGVTNSLFGIEHDQQLNVVAITDPLGRMAESYVLDGNERIVAVTNRERQVMTREYAVGGVVASETRFDGTEVHYGYDTDGNLASVSFPGETLSFAYDIDGLLVSASNSVGAVSNSFDAATGWLAASVGADGTEVSYTRRNGGGVAAISSVAGTTSYSYDMADRLSSVSSPAGSFGFGYCDWNGMLASVTNASGLVTEYAYDVMDRVTNISWRTSGGASFGGFAYEYDAVGRIVSRSHALGTNAFDRAYAYDDLDRLASDGGVTYTYDAAGNRMTKTEDGETITYTLGVGDRLATWTGGAYSYDAAGCVTRIERDGRPTLDLAWNGQYQLVSVSTNGVFAESYEYDALGRRVATTTLDGTTRHVYDSNWQVIADVDDQGNVIASYVWGDGIDNLLAVNVSGATYYPLTDIQGTIWGYVDSQNNVVACWQYDAWGNVVDEEIAPNVAALAAIRYRFQCREWSAATGLINFRMRWYDAETGRWLSKDPIGLSGGLNLYAFCESNVINSCDEFGLVFRNPQDVELSEILESIQFLRERFRKGNGPYWHHAGREARNVNLPIKPPHSGIDGWIELPQAMSVYHDNGVGNPERKFINVDGREVVYDGDKDTVIGDNKYKGTYNYINPRTKYDPIWTWLWKGPGHFFADMLPYYIWGN